MRSGARERERRVALEAIARQVESGRLVIRRATAEERERYGIRAPDDEIDREDADAAA